MSVVALVPAAGRGERLSAGTAKAFVRVAGAPLLLHAVRRLLASGCVDSVVVAAPPAALELASDLLTELGDRVHVVAGGSSRTDSVRLALAAALRESAVDIVLVHDAARAFVPPALVSSVVAAVRAGAPAVVPVLPVTDTIKRADAHGRIVATVDRSSLLAVQTPQGFRLDVLVRAHELAGAEATDDAGLVERLGEPVHTVPGDRLAFKITNAFDLLVAEAAAHGAEAAEPAGVEPAVVEPAVAKPAGVEPVPGR